MAFKPRPDQQYYLIPKHSEKEKEVMALGIDNGNRGTRIRLKKFNPESATQKFKFDRGPGFCWIKLPAYDLYMDVASESQADGADVVAWAWFPRGQNQMFELVPVGDGYYRIMARHSRKYMDVYGADKTENGVLVQHRLMGSDNQVFKPVLVTNQPIGANPVSFKESNELMRTGVLAVIGLVPEVGAGLKFIVGFFWKEENKLAAIWEQMKSYVDSRIVEFIMADKLKSMGEELVGKINSIKLIYESKGNDRGTRLMGVLDRLIEMEPRYVNQSQEVLPYLVGFGTIVITLCHTMATEFDKLFLRQPTQDEKDENLNKLKDKISYYSAKVAENRTRIMALRMEKIPEVALFMAGNASDSKGEMRWEDNDTIQKEIADFESRECSLLNDSEGQTAEQFFSDETGEIVRTSDTVHSNSRDWSRADDYYDGWQQYWERYWSKTHPYTFSDHKERAEFALQQRRKQVEVQYNAELDEFLSAARFWKYFDASVPRYKEVKISKSVGTFGGRDANKSFEGVEGKPITSVKFFSSDGKTCGIEVFYGWASDGVKGQKGNGETTLELGTDEYISSVYGFAWNKISGLYFSTNKGNVKGNGRLDTWYAGYKDDSHFFIADLPDTLNAKLVRISGAHNDDVLQQLTFHWEYMY
jgi:hypothetical protein